MEVAAIVVAGLAFLVSLGTMLYTGRQSSAAVSQAASAERQVGVALQQLEFSERIHREQTDPYVVVDIRPRVVGSQLLCLVITNTGPTVARNVRVRVSQSLRSSLGAEYEMRLALALAREIPFMPPGQTLMWAFDTGAKLYERPDLPREYSFTVRATGPSGEIEAMTYQVDLELIRHTVLNRETTEWRLKEVADQVESLVKAVEIHDARPDLQ